METFNAESFVIGLAILGSVIAVSALLSGLVDRTGFPQVAVFLGLGAMLGPHGLNLLDVGLQSPLLRVVATLSLTLVLFTDALSLNIAEVRRNASLAARLLGPGTLLSGALMSIVAWRLLDLPLPVAMILGASLASTDPVLLRGLLRREEISVPARLGLRLESGLNDVVLLPIVVVAIILASTAGGAGTAHWGGILLSLFVLGPVSGVLVGIIGVAMLDFVRRRLGVRRDYESLYSLGLAFAAYAAAEAVHGSGFLSAFAAGLTIAALDVELCDCFLEYGEVTAEMLLLLTFVLFGTSLIWEGLSGLGPAVAVFAVFAILIRLPVYLASLVGSGVDRRSALLISWFGGRGLSSLLLVLLAVFAGLQGADEIFHICCAVVLLSVVVHGGSPMVLAWTGHQRNRRAAAAEPPEEPVAAPATGDAPATQSTQAITLDELAALRASGARPVIVDVRTERTYEPSDLKAQGAVRLNPEYAVRDARAQRIPLDAWVIPYCT